MVADVGFTANQALFFAGEPDQAQAALEAEMAENARRFQQAAEAPLALSAAPGARVRVLADRIEVSREDDDFFGVEGAGQLDDQVLPGLAIVGERVFFDPRGRIPGAQLLEDEGVSRALACPANMAGL